MKCVYESGQNVKLTANPAEGYQFVGWEGDANGMATTTVMMNSNKSVVAKFDKVIRKRFDLYINTGYITTGFATIFLYNSQTGRTEEITRRLNNANGDSFESFYLDLLETTGKYTMRISFNFSVADLATLPDSRAVIDFIRINDPFGKITYRREFSGSSTANANGVIIGDEKYGNEFIEPWSTVSVDIECKREMLSIPVK